MALTPVLSQLARAAPPIIWGDRLGTLGAVGILIFFRYDCFLSLQDDYNQGRNHGEMLAVISAVVGRICPPWSPSPLG